MNNSHWRVDPGPLHFSQFRDFSLQIVLEPQFGEEGQEAAGWHGVWRLSNWPDQLGAHVDAHRINKGPFRRRKADRSSLGLQACLASRQKGGYQNVSLC